MSKKKAKSKKSNHRRSRTRAEQRVRRRRRTATKAKGWVRWDADNEWSAVEEYVEGREERMEAVLTAAQATVLPDVVTATDLWASLIFHLDEVCELEPEEVMTCLQRFIAQSRVVQAAPKAHVHNATCGHVADKVQIIQHPEFPEGVIEVAPTDAFDQAWATLESEGGCDSHGGMEYNRVRGEWVAADQPSPVETFIREASNRPSP